MTEYNKHCTCREERVLARLQVPGDEEQDSGHSPQLHESSLPCILSSQCVDTPHRFRLPAARSVRFVASGVARYSALREGTGKGTRHDEELRDASGSAFRLCRKVLMPLHQQGGISQQQHYTII